MKRRRSAVVLGLACLAALVVLLPFKLPVTGQTSDPVVAAAGDIACDPQDPNYNAGAGTATACRMLATSDLVVARAPAAVLALGDTQYEDGTIDEFNTSYEPSWGRVKASTYPVPGNHEYMTSGAAGYYAYFGAAAGDPALGYYSYTVGTWHVIALNSNCAAVGGCGLGSNQERWLRDDLAANPASCILAYWHHPRFSTGSHGNDVTYDAFWRALYDANADVILVGHDHNYQRFSPQDPDANVDLVRGIRQFIVGTGGKSLSGFLTKLTYVQARNANTFGVLLLTLHPDSYDWQFVPIAGQSFTDTGSGSCVGAVGPTPTATPTPSRTPKPRSTPTATPGP